MFALFPCSFGVPIVPHLCAEWYTLCVPFSRYRHVGMTTSTPFSKGAHRALCEKWLARVNAVTTVFPDTGPLRPLLSPKTQIMR